jgi:hypothetical protein
MIVPNNEDGKFSIMECYMIRKSCLVLSAGLVLAATACDQSTGLSTSISQAAANSLAADMVSISSLAPTDIGFGPLAIRAPGSVSTPPITVDPVSVTVTRQCPKGGQARIEAIIIGSGDPSTRSFALEAVALRTDADCAFQTADGVLTLNGNPNIAFNAKVNIVNGALSGLQTQTNKGSFKWARPGGAGVCDVDLTSSFDPATHIATVTGTFCGKTVNVTQTRFPPD